jgi:hypothetical protein
MQECLDDGRLRESASSDAHRAQCPSCHEAWDRAGLLSDAIAAWRVDVPEVDFVDPVMARMTARSEIACVTDAAACQSGRHALSSGNVNRVPLAAVDGDRGFAAPRKGRTVFGVTAAAAAALVILSAWVYRPRSIEETPSPTIAESSPSKSASKEFESARGEPGRGADAEVARLDRADGAWGSLARTAAVTFDEFAAAVVPATPSNASDGMRERWLDGIEHRLKPIGKSLGDAFDFLWEAGKASDSSRT